MSHNLSEKSVAQASEVVTLIRDAGEARAVLVAFVYDHMQPTIFERAKNARLHAAIDKIYASVDRLATLAQAAEGMAEALKPFATEAAVYDPDEGDSHLEAWGASPLIGELRTARTALQTYRSHQPQPAAQASGEPQFVGISHKLADKPLSGKDGDPHNQGRPAAAEAHAADMTTAGAGDAASAGRAEGDDLSVVGICTAEQDQRVKVVTAPGHPAPGGEAEPWRPMDEVPTDRPVLARKAYAGRNAVGWWYAMIRVWRHEDGDGGRFGDEGYELLHYNGDVSMGRFYGPFDSWREVGFEDAAGGSWSGVEPVDLQQVVYAECERNNGGCACKVTRANLGRGEGVGARCEERYNVGWAVLTALVNADRSAHERALATARSEGRAAGLEEAAEIAQFRVDRAQRDYGGGKRGKGAFCMASEIEGDLRRAARPQEQKR